MVWRKKIMVRRCGRDWERMWCGEVDLLPPIRFQSCNLVAELVVTKEAGNIFHLYLQFLLFWETEERFALFNDVLNQCIIDTCIFDIKEAHIEESVTQSLEESWFSIWMP